MKPLPLVLPFLLLTLAGCGAAASASGPATPPAIVQPTEALSGEDLSRVDEQGAVTVTITPLNLDNPGETLDFEVGLNTHSVDLSMDLAALATLTTDTGLTVNATRWDAPSGGHHVSGRLSFPTTVDGSAFLQKSAKLTLTLRNLDAPERVFIWEISK